MVPTPRTAASVQCRKLPLTPNRRSLNQIFLLLLLLLIAPFLEGASIELTPDFVDNLLDKPVFPLTQFSSSWKTSGFCDTSSSASPDEATIEVIKRLMFR